MWMEQIQYFNNISPVVKKWNFPVLKENPFEEKSQIELKRILSSISNDTKILNEFLFFQSLFGWGDNLKYDKDTLARQGSFTSLKKFGYNKMKAKYHSSPVWWPIKLFIESYYETSEF